MNSPLYIITGATGHIGYALLKKMESLPVRIRILIRKDTPIFDGIDCEKVYGDVTDPDSLVRAFTGADIVFHLAGIIDINVGNEDAIWRVNFEGTKNVVRAAQKCGVRRIVYASSVDAFDPLPGNQLMRETDDFDPDKLDGTYAKTKAAATNFVLHTCRTENLDAVIVYPGACIGPYDFKVSNAGEMVRMFMRGSFPVSLAFGAYNFVDVRDVADGMIAAAEKGKSGEGYILCGEQITTHGFIKTVAEVCGKKCPKIRMNKGIVSLAAPVMEVYYKLSHTTPLFTRYTIRKLVSNCNFSIAKAKRELGYNPMSVRQSVQDMVAWIREYEGDQ
ncbi:MAG: NAD-dependent epimerase/dehydratase family protein [Clostridia bacterium]|nr:NAD-dependent epimerase/dehydratase family protein [Clostridia bacterium]